MSEVEGPEVSAREENAFSLTTLPHTKPAMGHCVFASEASITSEHLWICKSHSLGNWFAKTSKCHPRISPGIGVSCRFERWRVNGRRRSTCGRFVGWPSRPFGPWLAAIGVRAARCDAALCRAF